MKHYEIKTDLHTHTLASTHAYSTLEENCRAAFTAGLQGINISDHCPAMPDAPCEDHFSNLRILPRHINGVRVWRGAEVNILDENGNIDLTERTLGRLECVVASLHEQTFQAGPPDKQTSAYLNVIRNPKVHILGHSGTAGYPFDYERVIKEAAFLGKAMELNEGTFRVRPASVPNCREIIRLCKKLDCYICVDSDAHFSGYIGQYPEGIKLLEELDFPPELIVNRSLDSVEGWLEGLTPKKQ